MLTIFGNLKINSKERLQHMKDSFQSFKNISDNWVLNVRGTFRDEAVQYLQEQLGSSLTLFTLLDDTRGWIENALDMMPSVKHEYVLLWNEDHVNVAPQEIYKNIVSEMKEARADYLLYSWWMDGASRKALNALPMNKMQHIDVIHLDKPQWQEALKKGHPYYLLSLLGIYRKEFLIPIMKRDRIKLPQHFIRYIFMALAMLERLHIHFDHTKAFQNIHKMTGYRLRRFSKEAPFDLEKSPDRFDILPFTMALPHQELFACIDDDLGSPGYSLVSRGKYSNPESGLTTVQHIQNILEEIRSVLLKTQEEQVNMLVREILRARKIVAIGAGRVGLAIKGFTMRLGHLGRDAYIVGDTTLPSLNDQDLVIVASGSGETKSVYHLAEIAKAHGARIALITGNPHSSMGRIADTIVEVRAPSKTKSIEGFSSTQPMTTLNEQCLSIFFDALVLCLMEELNETHDSMWARHTNLE